MASEIQTIPFISDIAMDVPDIDLADVRNILNKTKSLLEAREAQSENSFGFFVEGILLVGRFFFIL